MVLYGPVWPCIVPNGPKWPGMVPCPVLSSMVLYGPIHIVPLVLYGTIWSRIVLYSPVFNCMVLHGLIWSRIVQYRFVWSCWYRMVP